MIEKFMSDQMQKQIDKTNEIIRNFKYLESKCSEKEDN